MNRVDERPRLSKGMLEFDLVTCIRFFFPPYTGVDLLLLLTSSSLIIGQNSRSSSRSKEREALNRARVRDTTRSC